MDEDKTSGHSWADPVICDLAQAFRRDGFVKSAELLDDLRIVLEQEARSLENARKAGRDEGSARLKLISG